MDICVHSMSIPYAMCTACVCHEHPTRIPCGYTWDALRWDSGYICRGATWDDMQNTWDTRGTGIHNHPMCIPCESLCMLRVSLCMPCVFSVRAIGIPCVPHVSPTKRGHMRMLNFVELGAEICYGGDIQSTIKHPPRPAPPRPRLLQPFWRTPPDVSFRPCQ